LPLLRLKPIFVCRARKCNEKSGFDGSIIAFTTGHNPVPCGDFRIVGGRIESIPPSVPLLPLNRARLTVIHQRLIMRAQNR
jgi:hypothetical protein